MVYGINIAEEIQRGGFNAPTAVNVTLALRRPDGKRNLAADGRHWPEPMGHRNAGQSWPPPRARASSGIARSWALSPARRSKFGRKPQLSDYQRAEAIKRRTAGERLADIAKSYAVDISMISRLT